MSWNFSVPQGKRDDFEAACETAVTAYKTQLESNDVALDPDTERQIKAAVHGAVQLVKAGLVRGSHVGGSLSGHAAPDPGPTGSNYDSANVSVSGFNPAPTPTPSKETKK